MPEIRFDSALIARYDRNGPRYTSYPTALQFHAGFDATSYRKAAAALRPGAAARPLSVYVHVPFCASPCFYCGCNKVITRDRSKAVEYIAYLKREIELQAGLFDRTRSVVQLHFGGGTPTFLKPGQLQELLDHLRRHFGLTEDAHREYSIEIDPRTVDRAALRHLSQLGFNRLSLGVQDFDPAVQLAVNRVQPVAATLELVEEARALPFRSISFDLIYGLPRQTPTSFARTLDIVTQARPDRLAVYGYAHMPRLFKPQRQIRQSELPSAATRLELLQLAVEKLTSAGYEYIGMDHFALPGDELSRARASGELHRNFQGYSTHADSDLVGLGVSAIGKLGDSYAQNARALPQYYAALDRGELPVERGIELTRDDVIRRAVMQRLMCQGLLECREIETRYDIHFRCYFAREWREIERMLADGLLSELGERIVVSAKGQHLLRNLAMAFDAYLQTDVAERYSKAI